MSAFSYKPVPAGTSGVVLGTTGAAGDFLAGLLMIPASTSPGTVNVADGTSAVTLFAGGTVGISPFYVPLGVKSTNGAWSVTTGASISVLGVGSFS